MSVQSVQNNPKVMGGLCPHGLPSGACPICSGMGGGGVKKADHTAKPGEMSWNQCAAIGQMLRAQQNAKVQKAQDIQNHLKMIANFQTTLAKAAQATAQFTAILANNILTKPIATVINNTILPAMNFIKNVPINVLKFVNTVTQKFIDIQDKLNAMFGELKNSIEKKINESWKNITQKIHSFFFVENSNKSDNEDKRVDEAKRTFELKTFLNDLYNRITKTTQSYNLIKKEAEKEKNQKKKNKKRSKKNKK